MMKLWLIEQDANNGYDTYDNAVVAAETEEAARDTMPSSYSDKRTNRQSTYFGDWAPFEKVKAIYIGEAREGMPAGVVCASFNAG